MKRKIRLYKIWRCGKLSLCKSVHFNVIKQEVINWCNRIKIPPPYLTKSDIQKQLDMTAWYLLGVVINKCKGEC